MRPHYLLAILLLFSCSEEQSTPEANVNEPTPDPVSSSDTSYQGLINANYHVYALPIPGSLDFAGEEVPLDKQVVRESLDRELLVNTYWHSSTFLSMKRANRWFPVIEEILAANDIPDDFKYLCMIESGLDNVVSPAGASGFWQFMSSTGKGYGLEINGNVDERYHVVKATEAACQYLQDAYDKLGSWTLAAAAYNMGKAGVTNSMDHQLVGSYYDLHLNSETARYVYRILALKMIMTTPANYGFTCGTAHLYGPYRTVSIEVDSSITDLPSFAISQGTTYKIIKLLNPWLRGDDLHNSAGKIYEILLPADDFDEPNNSCIFEQ